MTKLHFTAVSHAEESLLALRALYGDCGPEDADIVVALGVESFEYTVSPVLEVLDPTSGAQVWQSPPLRGYVPPNSLNYYDLTGSGRMQMVFGTSVGMYVTQ